MLEILGALLVLNISLTAGVLLKIGGFQERLKILEDNFKQWRKNHA